MHNIKAVALTIIISSALIGGVLLFFSDTGYPNDKSNDNPTVNHYSSTFDVNSQNQSPKDYGTDQDEYSNDEYSEDFIEQLNQAIDIAVLAERRESISLLLNQLTQDNALDVVYWLSQQAPSDELGEYYYIVLQFYMNYDMQTVGDIISELPSFDSKQSLVNDYTYKLAETQPEQTLIWLNDIVEQNIKNNAYLPLFEVWMNNNSQQAIDQLAILPEISENIRRTIIQKAVNSIASKLDRYRTDELFQYPKQFQPALAYSIISYWPTEDIDNAYLWIYDLPQGDIKDLAIKSYIDSVGITQDASISFALVATVSNKEQQLALVSRVFEQWYAVEEDIAQQNLNNFFTLSQQQKELLVAQQQNMQNLPRLR